MSTFTLPNGVTVARDARARRITFSGNMLQCELEDGRLISVPLAWYPRIRDASEGDRTNWILSGRGRGIYWPTLDEDLSVNGFLAGCMEPEEDTMIEEVKLTRHYDWRFVAIQALHTAIAVEPIQLAEHVETLDFVLA